MIDSQTKLFFCPQSPILHLQPRQTLAIGAAVGGGGDGPALAAALRLLPVLPAQLHRPRQAGGHGRGHRILPPQVGSDLQESQEQRLWFNLG